MYSTIQPLGSVPELYNSLDLRQIKVSNVPQWSRTVTPVLLITLNRPEKLNSFTDIMREDLERVYSLIDIDPRVKAVVITGAGKSFCAGADLDIGFPGVRDENGALRRPKVERDIDHRDGLVKLLNVEEPPPRLTFAKGRTSSASNPLLF